MQHDSDSSNLQRSVLEKLYESAYALLSQPMSDAAVSMQFVRSVAPVLSDYEKVFVAEAVATAQAHYSPLFAFPRPLSRGSQQTELRLWIATARDLQEANDAAQFFPGGYADIAHFLKPETVWVHWKYVAPGAGSGMAYDGLVWINDRWVFFPKPFRALSSIVKSESSSEKEEQSASESQHQASPKDLLPDMSEHSPVGAQKDSIEKPAEAAHVELKKEVPGNPPTENAAPETTETQSKIIYKAWEE